MRYIEALDNYIYTCENLLERKIFLAGGITGCLNWQQQMVQLLADTDLTLLNPRRENFPINDPLAANAQIMWEHVALRVASAILFWFPRETLCPIVLYELGTWSMATPAKSIFIGVCPEYARRQDVEMQTGLIRPEVEIVFSLEALAGQLREYNAYAVLIDKEEEQ